MTTKAVVPYYPDIPWSQEAEEAVLGAVLISANMFPILQGFLQARHFYLTRCRFIWQAFTALSERGAAIDMVSVATHLQDMDAQMFRDIGAFAHLICLTQACENSMNAETYGRQVHGLAIRREMLETADVLRAAAGDPSVSADMAINRLDRKAVDLRRELTRVDAPIRTMQQATYAKLQEYFERRARQKENPNYVIGVRTGIHDLDRLLDGLRPGSITTLAGSTGAGKTALTLQIARFASQKGILRAAASPAKVHFFSGEMTESQLMDRLVSGVTGIPVRHLERGSFDDAQMDAIAEAMHSLDQTAMLTFEGGARMNTAQIRQRVRTLTMDNCLDLLVLDGLLQIEASKEDSKAAAQRRDKIEAIMDDLEDIALSYRVPILMTHQLSRAPAGRTNKRPQLSDLAEASFVEQKSAVILFLYREGYYDPTVANPNAAEIIVEKNRHGGTGTILTEFDRQFTRFLEANKGAYPQGGRP